MRAVIALLLLLVSAVTADAAGPRGRSEALAALDDRDAETRRLGAAELAERGTMADVPRLARALRDPDALVRAIAERSLWEVWSRSGDDAIDRLLAVGIEQMSERHGEAAVETFTQVIQRRPEFAEGWNKRATVYYLLGEYRKSLADCDEVMKRNPYHFGALAGYFQIYVQIEDFERALKYGRRALEVNPNMEGVRNGVEALERMLGRNRQVV